MRFLVTTLVSVGASLCIQSVALAAPSPQESPASVTSVVPAALHPAVELAKTMIGIPYRWAGADPLSGFDCSGLVYYVFNQLQVRLPRVPRELFHRTEQIGRSELQPGDLLFFHTFARLSHVGIYIGEGRFIHAPRRGKNVTIESIDSKYYQKRYAGARRVMNPPALSTLRPDPGF